MAFLNRLTPLSEGVFPMPSVAAQPLKRIAQAGYGKQTSGWAGAHQPLDVKKGKAEGLPKAPVRSASSKTFGHPCLACWWPTQHNATAVPLGLGMGALEDAIGSCAWQGPILTEERRLPKAQGTSDPFGPDLQTVSLGWEGRIHGCIGCGGSVLDTPRNVIIEILYQAPTCLSWRAWKSYESAEWVSGWGGEHKNNHHRCGRQYIMAGLPGWKVNAIRLCVCFSEG